MMEAYRKAIIQQVKNYPLLWDPNVESYNDKDERKRAWSLIDAALRPPTGITTNAKAVWEHLMRGYANALRRKEQRILRTGCAPPGTEWKFEKAMSFLVPVKTNRAIIAGTRDRIIACVQEDENSSEMVTPPSNSNSHALKEESDQAYYDSDTEHISGMQEDNDTDTEGVNAKEEVEDANDSENEAADRVLPDTVYQYMVPSENLEVNSRRSKRRKCAATLTPYATICSPSTSACNSTHSVRRPKRQLDDILGNTKLEFLASKFDNEATYESPRYGFFRSLMPMINKLSDDSFLDFQTDIIQSLKKHKNADET